jgi:hypothetical protein
MVSSRITEVITDLDWESVRKRYQKGTQERKCWVGWGCATNL